MSPTDHRKALKPGEKRFAILGQEVTVDFNDRVFLRSVLDLYARIKATKQQADDGGEVIDIASVTLDLIDEADELVTKAVGAEARKRLWKGNPVKEPLLAFIALVGPAGKAYEELFADIAGE